MRTYLNQNEIRNYEVQRAIIQELDRELEEYRKNTYSSDLSSSSHSANCLPLQNENCIEPKMKIARDYFLENLVVADHMKNRNPSGYSRGYINNSSDFLKVKKFSEMLAEDSIRNKKSDFLAKSYASQDLYKLKKSNDVFVENNLQSNIDYYFRLKRFFHSNELFEKFLKTQHKDDYIKYHKILFKENYQNNNLVDQSNLQEQRYQPIQNPKKENEHFFNRLSTIQEATNSQEISRRYHTPITNSGVDITNNCQWRSNGLTNSNEPSYQIVHDAQNISNRKQNERTNLSYHFQPQSKDTQSDQKHIRVYRDFQKKAPLSEELPSVTSYYSNNVSLV